LRAKEVATGADVTLRQLRYFAVLGKELNYRRAAGKLFITQPALSTAIKQLEHQFGVALFTRNTREVALTDVGAAWLPTYVPIVDRPPSYTALAWNPATLTREGELLVRHVQQEWNSGDGQDLETWGSRD
jgi:hypothetical protein